MTIIDDYGHHPVEIAAVLQAARESTKGQVIAVVQPHRYTRLQSLFEQFSTCFNDADTVIVAHVYPAGEAPIAGADRDALVQGLRAHGHRQVIPLDGPQDLARIVKRIAKPGDYRRLPRRRQHHAVGLRAAGRTRGARGGGVMDGLSRCRRYSYVEASSIAGADMNKATLRKELMELSPAERLELIGELWDSIPPQDGRFAQRRADARRSSAATKR